MLQKVSSWLAQNANGMRKTGDWSKGNVPNETLRKDCRIFASPPRWGKHEGLVAEWLGSALQKLLQRFESAPDLQRKGPAFAGPSSMLWTVEVAD